MLYIIRYSTASTMYYKQGFKHLDEAMKHFLKDIDKQVSNEKFKYLVWDDYVSFVKNILVVSFSYYINCAIVLLPKNNHETYALKNY
jgi:hypothetical protein